MSLSISLAFWAITKLEDAKTTNWECKNTTDNLISKSLHSENHQCAENPSLKSRFLCHGLLHVMRTHFILYCTFLFKVIFNGVKMSKLFSSGSPYFRTCRSFVDRCNLDSSLNKTCTQWWSCQFWWSRP